MNDLAFRYSWHDLEDAVSWNTPFTSDISSVARILADKRLDTGRDDPHARVVVIVQDGLTVSTDLVSC